MKFAILSDTHFGDKLSALVWHDPQTGKFRIGEEKYGELKSRISKLGSGQKPYLDYLILLGDIFDFSVANYHDAYQAAKCFFQRIKQDEIAAEIIYVPGNHDFDMWHTIEYQVNVINRILKKHIPTQFRMSVPGVLDLRANSRKKIFTIPGISSHNAQEHKYAGLFLDQITEPNTSFNFVYPNLYIVTDQETIVATHGQYLESFWAFFAEELAILAGDDLAIGDEIDLREMVAYNFPICQLASSGIGQAGKFSTLAHKIESDVYNNQFENIEKYLDRLAQQVKVGVQKKYGKHLGHWIFKYLYHKIKKKLKGKISEIGIARYNQDFFNEEKVKQRAGNYFKATLNEIIELNNLYHYQIPMPQVIIFGHTHEPVGWKSSEAPTIEVNYRKNQKKVRLYNTGGWLYRKTDQEQKIFPGAEIFFYQSTKGFWSERV